MEGIVLASAEETISFGVEIGKQVKPAMVLALQGNLGAGKTTFVQGLLQGIGIQDVAQSPTFTYLQIYQGKWPIYHFDLYRLKSEKDFVLLGFEEYLYGDGIVVIEWPERIPGIIPKGTKLIELHHENNGRKAVCTTWGLS